MLGPFEHHIVAFDDRPHTEMVPPLFRKMAMIVSGYVLGASFSRKTTRLIAKSAVHANNDPASGGFQHRNRARRLPHGSDRYAKLDFRVILGALLT
mgnify:CR=1 FL=1